MTLPLDAFRHHSLSPSRLAGNTNPCERFFDWLDCSLMFAIAGEAQLAGFSERSAWRIAAAARDGLATEALAHLEEVVDAY